jgi:hypothetical protein
MNQALYYVRVKTLYSRSRYKIITLILNLGIRCKLVVRFTPRPLYPVKIIPHTH